MKKKRTPTVRSESQRDSEAGANELIRLNRYLALNGIASRRRADELIQEGEVMLDGEIVTELGTKIDPTRQRVEVDGVVLRPEGEQKRYYLLNKPAGVVCTNERREYRPRAVDLITDKHKGRIYTVGRLDEDTVGLVLLTNDGDFAYRVSHPRYRVLKTYKVTVTGRVTEEAMRKLREGVRLSDFRSKFEKVWFKKRGENRSVLLLTLQEGRNREIRRVFAKLGFPVRDLKRVEIGRITERGLKVGHWRPLTRDEVRGLLEITREGEAQPVPKDIKRARFQGRPSFENPRPARPKQSGSPMQSGSPKQAGRRDRGTRSGPGQSERSGTARTGNREGRR